MIHTAKCSDGLVRQYFPEGSDFTVITDQQVQAVAEWLNERTRKALVLCNLSFWISLCHSGDSASLALAESRTATRL
jgi:hypothetical protein